MTGTALTVTSGPSVSLCLSIGYGMKKIRYQDRAIESPDATLDYDHMHLQLPLCPSPGAKEREEIAVLTSSGSRGGL